MSEQRVEKNPARFLLSEIEFMENGKGTHMTRLRECAGEQGVRRYHSRILAAFSFTCDLVEASGTRDVYEDALEEVWEFFVQPRGDWEGYAPPGVAKHWKQILASLALNLDSSPLLASSFSADDIGTLMEALETMDELLAGDVGVHEHIRGRLKDLIVQCREILERVPVNLWEVSSAGFAMCGVVCVTPMYGEGGEKFRGKLFEFLQKLLAPAYGGFAEALGVAAAGAITS